MKLIDQIEMLVWENETKQYTCEGISDLTIGKLCDILNTDPISIYIAIVYEGWKKVYIPTNIKLPEIRDVRVYLL